MRDKILSDFYRSRELTELINKMEPRELREDLKQELFVVLCELPEFKLLELYDAGALRYWTARTVVQMIQSKNSRFYYKFRKRLQHERPVGLINFYHEESYIPEPQGDDNDALKKEADFTALVTDTKQAIEELNFYQRELLKSYLALGSASKVVEDLKTHCKGHFIPKRSILNTVREAKQNIYKKVKPANYENLNR